MARYIVGVENLYRELGTLVWIWGCLEFDLSRVFAGLLGPPHNKKLTLFYAIPGNQGRIQLLRTALNASDCSDEVRTEAIAVINKFQALNKSRNAFVHSLYVIGDPNPEVFQVDMTTSSQESDGWSVGKGEKLNASALKNHCNAVEKLRERSDKLAQKLGVSPLY